MDNDDDNGSGWIGYQPMNIASGQLIIDELRELKIHIREIESELASISAQSQSYQHAMQRTNTHLEKIQGYLGWILSAAVFFVFAAYAKNWGL